MRQTLILAKSTTEANRYARLFGLQPFTYRAVSRAGSIRNLRSAEVHVLPSFLRRVDRHAIVMALRQAKVDIFYVDPVDLVDERLNAGDEPQQSWIAAGWVDQDCDALPQDWHPAEMDQAPNTDDAKFGTFDETNIEPFAKALDEHVAGVETADAEMSQDDDIAEESSDDDIEPVDEDINSKKRRRKRCKVCEQLVWNDDDPAHDAEAHATTEALKATPDNFFG